MHYRNSQNPHKSGPHWLQELFGVWNLQHSRSLISLKGLRPCCTGHNYHNLPSQVYHNVIQLLQSLQRMACDSFYQKTLLIYDGNYNTHALLHRKLPVHNSMQPVWDSAQAHQEKHFCKSKIRKYVCLYLLFMKSFMQYCLHNWQNLTCWWLKW